jgi:beta-glucosidase
MAETDLPEFDNESDAVTYGFLHGYRHLDAGSAMPRFPFGFGLGYTTVTYDDVTVGPPNLGENDVLTVDVDLSNTGDRPVTETVQVYVSLPDAGMAHAPKDLRGFGQLDLDGGASGAITIEIPTLDLAHWNTDAQAWELPTGEATVRVGPNVLDLPLEASVSFAG